MFNQETCQNCGTCRSKCPIFEMSQKDAKREMALLIQGKGSGEIIENCIGCGYCDIICPTQSNPSHIIKEIKHKRNCEKGVPALTLITEKVPANIMSIGLEFEKENKLKKLGLYAKTTSGKEVNKKVFYLGCSLSYIYTDLADTKLLNNFPAIGGMKFCCGGFTRKFGDEEAAIKGRELLQELKNMGVEKMIIFCPGCKHMLGDVYPGLIPEFDIETVNIASYLLEEHRKGKITFSKPLNKKVTFHDSCSSRNMGIEAYENPRKLLEAMGAEVVEMKHNRRHSMCCGVPLASQNPGLAANVAGRRISEAEATGAEAIVVDCTGCFALWEKATEHGLDIYHIIELAQLAIGEKPLHRIKEIKSQYSSSLFRTISKNPDLLKQRYIIQNGEIKPV